MAEVKISQLPTASALTGNELMPMVQSGVTVKAQASLAAGSFALRSITSLQAVTWAAAAAPNVVLLNYNYFLNDGGGLYAYDAADTTSLDDGGCIIVTASGLRYKRQISGALPLAAYGVHPARTGLQNSAGIAAALVYANANTIGKLAVPPSTRSVPIKIAKTIDLIGYDNIIIQGEGVTNFGIYKSAFRWDGPVGGVMLRTNKECRYVRIVSNANVDISTLNNGDVVNGVALATGDYVLLKNQTIPSQNGPYLIGAAAPAVRATYYTAGRCDDFVFYATEGTVDPLTYWQCTQDPASVTIGTTALTFTATTLIAVNKGGGFDGFAIDGYLTAAIGLSLWSSDGGDNGVVYAEGCTQYQVIMAAGRATNYMNATWRLLDINAYFSAAGTQNGAGGLKWTSTQGYNSSDVCCSRISYIRITHKDGIGFDQGASDTMIVDEIFIQQVVGGTGQSWIVRAGDGVVGDGGLSDYNYSYDNHFGVVGSQVAPLMESGTKPSISQRFGQIVVTSGYPVPDFSAAGVSGEWTTPDGQLYMKFKTLGAQWYRDAQGRLHVGYTAARTDGAALALYDASSFLRFRSEVPGANAKVWGYTMSATGTVQLGTYTDAGAYGAVAEEWERSGSTPTKKRQYYPLEVPNTGLKAYDTDNSHPLVFKPNSNLTAERILSITTGDAARELQLQDTAFTPTFTCDTVGDLSVAYATQLGRYMRVGKLIFFNIEIQFTPTYTTATGSWYLSGLPFTIENTGLDPGFAMGRSQNITRPVNATIPQCQGENNGTRIIFTWPLTTGGTTASAITNVPSGTAVVLAISGHYFTAA